MLVCVFPLVAQSVRLFVVPWAAAPPSSSVQGIHQASMLEWIAIPFSRGSSRPRNGTQVSRIVGRFFTI